MNDKIDAIITYEEMKQILLPSFPSKNSIQRYSTRKLGLSLKLNMSIFLLHRQPRPAVDTQMKTLPKK